MTPRSEKYVDGSAFTTVDDMRLGEYDCRHDPKARIEQCEPTSKQPRTERC